MPNELEKTKFDKVLNGKLFAENFSTVRLHNPDKYFVGAVHEIIFNGDAMGAAEVVAIRNFPFNTIREPLALLDANLSVAMYANMLHRSYGHELQGGIKNDTVFHHVIYHWKKRIFPTHVKLLNEYYQKILDEEKFIDTEPSV